MLQRSQHLPRVVAESVDVRRPRDPADTGGSARGHQWSWNRTRPHRTPPIRRSHEPTPRSGTHRVMANTSDINIRSPKKEVRRTTLAGHAKQTDRRRGPSNRSAPSSGKKLSEPPRRMQGKDLRSKGKTFYKWDGGNRRSPEPRSSTTPFRMSAKTPIDLLDRRRYGELFQHQALSQPERPSAPRRRPHRGDAQLLPLPRCASVECQRRSVRRSHRGRRLAPGTPSIGWPGSVSPPGPSTSRAGRRATSCS